MAVSDLDRVARREAHSPRTVAAVVVLVVVALAAAFAGVEIVRSLLGLTPLAVSPGAAVAWVVTLPDASTRAWAIGLGASATVVGIVLVLLAVSPGRRARHELGLGPHVVLVDNGVIASAVAERVRREFDLPRGNVVAGIGHRRADVTVRTQSGQQIERAGVVSVAEVELAQYDLSPRVRVRARVLSPDTEKGIA